MIHKKIEGIDFYELSDLIETAIFWWQDDWFSAGYPLAIYSGLNTAEENDTAADKIAKCLLAGSKVMFYDRWASDADDFHGELPHKFIDGEMVYYVTMNDVLKGLTLAANSSYISDRRAVANIDDYGCNTDADDAYRIIQYIMFGKRVRG